MLNYVLICSVTKRINWESFLNISPEIRHCTAYSTYIHVGAHIETNPFNNHEKNVTLSLHLES